MFWNWNGMPWQGISIREAATRTILPDAPPAPDLGPPSPCAFPCRIGQPNYFYGERGTNVKYNCLTLFTMTMTALFLFHSARYSSEPICRADQAAVPPDRSIPREPPTFSMNPSARRSSVGPWISWFHGSDGSAGRQVTSLALATNRCSGEPPTAPHFQVAANAKKGAQNRRWTARCP